MGSSALPLSLLAKGIGQVVTNGHEKLEVYLEPEDYYNLKSYSPYHVQALQENESLLQVGGNETKLLQLHKTFVTRKGALLIFSEELANKAIQEEQRRLDLKHQQQKLLERQQWEDIGETSSKYEESEKGDDPLRTVHDLRVAILMYGNRPEYRKRGDDLYLRFIHESKSLKDERKIRPGFSPKRYITAWSKYWHEEMLQKLRTSGLIQDKTIYRQNPLLPHLYQPASYNLSTVPPPYRVTRNMLHAGDVGTYAYHRPHRSKLQAPELLDDKEAKISIRKEPPPSTDSKVVKKEGREPIPLGSIQAVRFLETGEVQEVKYSELKPQEKKEILAELLQTAWEHGKHIEEMLDLVLAANKPRTQSAASSSAASELMMDMHRAILSLADSPIQRQLQQKQQVLKIEEEKQKRKDKREAAKLERKRQRQRRREEREAQIAREHENQEADKKHAEEDRQRRKERIRKQAEQKELIHEAEQQRILQEEYQKQAEHDEREKRREARREARRKKDEERVARKKEKEEEARKQQEEEEQRILEEKQEREQRREERRRQRAERKQKKEQEEKEREESARMRRETRHADGEDQHVKTQDQRKHADDSPRHYSDQQQSIGQPVDQSFNRQEHRQQPLQDDSVILHVDMVNQSETMLKSRQMPAVPQNTPATQQRVVGIQRQVPLQNVIYEAKSKRSHGSSSSTSSTHSRRRAPHAAAGTLISDGDGQFAHYSSAQPIPPTKPQKRTKQRKLSPLQQQPIELAFSIVSSHSSKPNVFPAVLPGDTASSHGKSSFYGGAMPITSNIVKQTLSDKISLLSASQDNSSQHHSLADTYPHVNEQYGVPVIGVEPPTPVQPSKQQSQVVIPPSPVQSASTKSTLKKTSDKASSLNYSNESEDEPYLSDHSSRSLPRSVRSEGKQPLKSVKKSSTTVSGGTLASTSETGYQAMKGMKGPGSQSSAAALSHKTGSKKSSSITRGSLPNALLKRDQAAIFMPDKEIIEIDVNIKPDLLSSTYKSTTIKSSVETETVTELQKLSIKPSLKDNSQESSSVKSSGRVSFQDETAEGTTEEETDEKEAESKEQEAESEEESEASEETEKDDAWPEPTKADLRPISSRSAKLTEHAQKVAQIVIEGQRTDSRLEEDATEAAKLWNAVAKSQEGSSEEESEDESEEEDEESSAAWNADQNQGEEKPKQEEDQKSSLSGKDKALKKIDQKPPKQKEIVARNKTVTKPPPAVAASVKSYKSTSSGKTSISSVQAYLDVWFPRLSIYRRGQVHFKMEAFVKEVRRKASELGIDESELQFDAQLVDKVYNSTIEPEEVEVFHDTDAGKHVVRSRHSSVTTKSIKTDTTETSTSEKKKKFVIDLPTQEITAHSVTPHHSVSTTSSTTASPTSPSRFRALSQSSSVHSRKRKSSIPGKEEKDVSLEYELTSYEAKLGDPKPEEPVTVMPRPKLEPEKLVETQGKSDAKKTQGEKSLKEEKLKSKGKMAKTTGITESKEIAESVSSDKDSVKSKQTAEAKSQKKGKKGKQEKEKASKAGVKKETDRLPVSPEKPRPKTPEVPFVAGRAKENKVPKGLQSPPHTPSSVKKDRKTPGAGDTSKEPKTQVELEGKMQKGKVSEAKIKSKSGKGKDAVAAEGKTKSPEAKSPVKSERAKSETPLDEYEQLSPIPAESPEDDYAFVRVEETPLPSEPEEPVVEEKQDDEKSQVSDQTAPTETTDNTDELLKAAEDEAENEAKLAKKKEKEEKRLAAAEKRRLEVERKRKEKEEQARKEKEELERQDQMREELENERKRRAGEMQRKREEMEKEKEREKQEEIMRKKREEQQREREKRLQEEHKRKMEELQKKKKEEEERKAEIARIKAEEEEQARKEEEELMAQMAEEERIEYERRKREEAEQKKIEEEQRRLREEEEAKIAMEQARLQAIIKAKQQATLEEKLKFAREFSIEANGMDQTQNVNRAFSFSYFELLQLLGLEFTAGNADL
ncbi:uncharacterized protein LOC120337708 isoform X3 [Styela clava]